MHEHVNACTCKCTCTCMYMRNVHEKMQPFCSSEFVVQNFYVCCHAVSNLY